MNMPRYSTARSLTGLSLTALLLAGAGAPAWA